MDGFYSQQYHDVDYTNRGSSAGDTSGVGISSSHDDMSMFDDNAISRTANGMRRASMAHAVEAQRASQDPSHGVARTNSMPEFNGSMGNGQLNNFQFNPSVATEDITMPSGAMFQQQQVNGMFPTMAGNQSYQSIISPLNSFPPLQANSQMMQHNVTSMELAQQQMMINKSMHQFNNMISQSQFPPFMVTPVNAANFYQQQQQQQQQPHFQDSAASSRVTRTSTGQLPGPHTSQQNSPQAGFQHQQSQRMNGSGSASRHGNNSLGPNTATSEGVSGSHDRPILGAQESQEEQRQQQQQQQQQQEHHGQQMHTSMDPSINESLSGWPTQQIQQQLRRQQEPQPQKSRQHTTSQQKPISVPRKSDEPDPHNRGSFTNAYSSTGFDMLSVLVKVVTRPKPEINIGSVDLSCAFVVCDALEHDFPIIYCSENFERLTGYTKHEILGRNCRFLQAPDGRVPSGIKRQYVDDDTVLYLKNKITMRQEAQVSLINYRKGGQPFMNLLTMIPVSDDDHETRFFLGFQVDLVEQPSSVTNKNPDGTYAVNYQRGLQMPRYVLPVSDQAMQMEPGQTVSRDDVSTILSTFGAAESELSKGVWDKTLLENTDDVIFVLSLKGLFLYLSPSSRRILEYESRELTGTALSSVCHPSDIVPVTRELKETSPSANINVVFRIRRKRSGYMWFEGHGSLHTELGKGRKSIIMVGRERPVYSISRADIHASGGLSDNEVWLKLSTTGMFLFVSSSVRSMLDKTPEELMGTSIQALMRPESRPEFSRIMEVARSGRRASAKHELLNRRGQVLQAVSTVYPGDAQEGQKPTFFVAQTRLVKYNHAITSGGGSHKDSLAHKAETDPSLNNNKKAPLPAKSNKSASRKQGEMNTSDTSLPSPTHFISSFEAVTTHSGGEALQLGHQDQALASDLNLFDELKTTRSTSWQFELRQMEKRNRLLAEELQGLLAARKKRKRRKGAGMAEKDCANCHTKQTPEWRRGPSGNRDLCNSCGLRWAKKQGRISPRTTSQRSHYSDKASASPMHTASSRGMSGDLQRSVSDSGGKAPDDSPAGNANHKRGYEGGGASNHVSKSQRVDGSNDPSLPSQQLTMSESPAGVPTKVEGNDDGIVS